MTTEPMWDPEGIHARLDAQQLLIDALSNHLQAITDAVTQRMADEATAPDRWSDLPLDEARARWQQLRSWVGWLRERYALDPKALPWCWYLHGAMVEELTALWTAHLAAYEADADRGSPASWHDTLARTLPRLREWSGRTGCKPREHHDDIAPDPGEPEGRWEEHLILVARDS